MKAVQSDLNVRLSDPKELEATVPIAELIRMTRLLNLESEVR